MNYNIVLKDDHLEHHGILGQKWGKRNGPPYPLDANDHSAAEQKAGWKKSVSKSDDKKYSSNNSKTNNSKVSSKKNISSKSDSNNSVKKDKKNIQYIEKYLVSQGFSKEEAHERAEVEIRALKIFGVIAGTAAVTGIAYGIIKNKNLHEDITIPAGTIINRMDTNKSTEFIYDTFYGTYRKGDSVGYEGLYAKWKQGYGLDVFKKRITNSNELKIAGNDTAKNLYEDLLKNNSDFKKLLNEYNASNIFGNIVDYDSFNQNAPLDKDRRLFDMFKSELIERGYNGVIDVNDQTYSGYNTIAPVIFFNDGNYKVKDVKYWSSEQADVAVAKKLVKDLVMDDESLKQIAAYSGLWAGLYGIITTSQYLAGKELVEKEMKKDTKK